MRLVNRWLLVEEGVGIGKKYIANEEFCCEDSDPGLDVVGDEYKGNNIEKKVVSLYDLNLNNVKLSRVEEDILNIIINDGFTSTRINSEKLEIPKHISIRACNDLIEKGLIKREGCNRATKYVLVNNNL